MNRRRAVLLAMSAGVLYFVSYCGFEQYYLGWVFLVPLLWLVDDEMLSLREVTILGGVFGVTACFGGYHWMVVMLHDLTELGWVVAVLGALLFAALQGSRYAVWLLLVGWLGRRGASLLWTAPLTLIVIEWLYPGVFPLYVASAQYEQALLVQSADLFGPMGLSGLVVMSSALLTRSLAHFMPRGREFPVLGWSVFGVLLGANLAYGAWALHMVDAQIQSAPRTVAIATVQANVSTTEADAYPEAGHARLYRQSVALQEAGVELLVWPESAYGYMIPPDRVDFNERITHGLRTPVLLGSTRKVPGNAPEDPPRLYNTAFLVDARGQLVGTYDKNHLLVVGERIPFSDTIPALGALAPLGNYTPGATSAPLTLEGVSYGILICYEDLFPGYTRQLMAHAPDILVNLTNDVWFGRTSEASTHLAVATFRAIESRRFLVRATNTGVSAIIDHAGRIVARAPQWQTATLRHDVPVLQGQTIYARFGNWLPLGCLVWLLAWSARALVKSRRRS